MEMLLTKSPINCGKKVFYDDFGAQTALGVEKDLLILEFTSMKPCNKNGVKDDK
jgi:hypothetical protein